MTIEEMIARKRGEIAANLAARSKNVNELAAIRSKSETDDADEARVTELRAANETLDTERGAIEAKVAEYEAERAADAAADALAVVTQPGAGSPNAHRAPVTITSEERTYAAYKERSFDQATGKLRAVSGGPKPGAEFERDVAAAYFGDYEAQARLAKHMSEERVERAKYLSDERAAGTGAFAGLTVPQYLTDMYAPAAAAMRPFADACNKHVLPEAGMTVNLSRITTSTSVAIQASENSGVSETNIDDTLLTLNVQTNAGQQTLSRQAIERGTGVEAVVLDDLFRRYHTNLDSTVLNQATTGLAASASVIPYTSASPKVVEYYPIAVSALAAVEAAMLDQASGQNIAVMHSRRWYWLQNGLSSTWPLISQPGVVAQMLGENYNVAYGKGVRGILPNGTPVIVDNNVTTAGLAGATSGGTQDHTYVLDKNEAHLWEDPDAPVFIRAEQPAAASLGVLFVLYGYFAYTFSRYTQSQLISGTGTATPTFSGV
jgi:hypothetical protein